MFIAKIQSKEDYINGIKIHVLFTDGVKEVIEACVPQNEEGFRYWVKSRLETLNAGITLAELYQKDQVIETLDPIIVTPTLSQQEQDQNNWLKNYQKWVRVKTTLIDTGIITAANPQAAALLAELKIKIKVEYIDLI